MSRQAQKELDEVWKDRRTYVKVYSREQDNTLRITYPDLSYGTYGVSTNKEGKSVWYFERHNAEGHWVSRTDSDELFNLVFNSPEEALLDAHRNGVSSRQGEADSIDSLWGSNRTQISVHHREQDDTITATHPDHSYSTYSVAKNQEGKSIWICDRRTADGTPVSTVKSDEFFGRAFALPDDALLDAHRSALAI